MKRNVALVLGGGGGKGAYQIGAWQAIREYGIEKDIGAVAGTSVGALNGVLFLQGNLETANKVWSMVDNDKILHLNTSGHIRALKKFKLGRILTDGVFSNQGLLDLLETFVDIEKISQAVIPAFATCCPVPGFSIKNLALPKPTYFQLNGLSREQIISVLLASSAIPFVFDAVEINGTSYVDGGLADNVPIQPLYEQGFRKFIVVNLDMYQRLPREKYRDADIIEIMPDHSRSETITGILDFSPEAISSHVQAGYRDSIMTLSSRYTLPEKSSLARILNAFRPGSSGK